jgi:hypothetical protein
MLAFLGRIDGDMLRLLEPCLKPPGLGRMLARANAWKSLRRGVLRSDQANSHAPARGRCDCLRLSRDWCSILMRWRLPAAVAPAAWACDPRAFRFGQWPGLRHRWSPWRHRRRGDLELLQPSAVFTAPASSAVLSAGRGAADASPTAQRFARWRWQCRRWWRRRDRSGPAVTRELQSAARRCQFDELRE